MKIDIKELISNSYVLTTSREKLHDFDDYFIKCGFNQLPRPFFGRFVDRNSSEYKNNRHFIAAHMSHFEICQYASLCNLPYVCIFEEDVLIAKDAVQKLIRYLNNIPDDAMILRLGYAAYRGIEQGRIGAGDIDCIDNEYYTKHDYSGSHSYIIFNSFYRYNLNMLTIYHNTLSRYKDIIPIHNWKNYTSELLKSVFFYEWMMNPFVYKHELQKHVYTINTRDCIFTLMGYIYNKEAAKEYFVYE